MFEELRLPSGEEFAKQAMRKTEPLRIQNTPDAIARESLASKAGRGVSEDFKNLMIQYCATCIEAYELSEVDFKPLAKRLGARVEFVAQAAKAADDDGNFWMLVMAERVRRVGAARVFRDVTWERIEGGALKMLDQLLEKKLIRDTGELLAVATAARKVADNVAGGGQNGNQQNTQVNISFGGSEMTDGLPASGAKMTIDLSPRLANSLAQRSERPIDGNRVIDSTMLSAKELREALAQQQTNSAANQEK